MDARNLAEALKGLDESSSSSSSMTSTAGVSASLDILRRRSPDLTTATNKVRRGAGSSPGSFGLNRLLAAAILLPWTNSGRGP